MTESREDRLSRIRAAVDDVRAIPPTDAAWLLEQIPEDYDASRIHAVAFNAVAPAVDTYNDAIGYEGVDRYYLTLSLRRAISKAVVKAIAAETGLPLAPAGDPS